MGIYMDSESDRIFFFSSETWALKTMSSLSNQGAYISKHEMNLPNNDFKNKGRLGDQVGDIKRKTRKERERRKKRKL